jgi:hypothetical protein
MFNSMLNKSCCYLAHLQQRHLSCMHRASQHRPQARLTARAALLAPKLCQQQRHCLIAASISSQPQHQQLLVVIWAACGSSTCA